jgi:hypothetical protein
MAHGSAIKEAWAARGKLPPKRGDNVDFFNMTIPCNGPVGPGPHRARVTSVNRDGSLHLEVTKSNLKAASERFVQHRGMADGPRFWDYTKKEQ